METHGAKEVFVGAVATLGSVDQDRSRADSSRS